MTAGVVGTAREFAHEALLVAAEGKLSKRLGSYGAEHLREEGVEPLANQGAGAMARSERLHP